MIAALFYFYEMKKGRVIKQQGLYVIVGLVIASLIGVQLYWIFTGVRLQKLAAERNLKNDLADVIKEVEESAYCFHFYSKAFIKKDEGIYIIKQQFKDGKFISPPQGYMDTLSLYNIFFNKKGDTIFDKDAYLDFQSPATVDVSLKFKFAVPSSHVKKIDTDSYKLPNINMANFQQSLNNSKSLDGLINPDNLDSLIKGILKKNDLDTVYEMGIRRLGSNNYEYMHKGSKPQHLQQGLIMPLLTDDNFNKPYQLFLYLPDKTGHALRSMGIVMVASIFIIICLIISYAWFVKTILNQDKLSEMKSMFINNITHEFNTPITNIHLAVENWRNARTNTDFYANIIEEENKHLQNNVAQMLQLAIMEHAELSTYIDKVDINALIQETVNAFSIQIERIKGTISFNLAEGIWLYGDRQLLRNLLYNLIDNAIKYSKGDPKIIISTFEKADKVILEIEDNGIGMTPETMKYMFERFYRGDKSDRHDIKGFGIGLSYVKYIVEAHKGTIDAVSVKGIGTTFIVQFPKNLK